VVQRGRLAVDCTPVTSPRARWRAPLLVAAFVALYAGLYRWLGPEAIPAPRADHLRVVCWNLRNFPSDHDRAQIRHRLDQLAPQVLALQEIRDPDELRALRPGWHWIASEHGGSHGPQRLVVGWDPAQVDVTDPIEHAELAMGGRIRPALSVHVRAHDGPDFYVVVVHLKATRSGQPTRRQQWPQLRDLVTDRLASGPDGEDDLLLLGDFNVAGGEDLTPEAERADLAEALAPAGLKPWTSAGGCTAYWDGTRRDRWWEPSTLDLVWSTGFDELPEPQRRAEPGTHCAQHGCAPFSSTEAHPDPDLHGISDHCPLVIDLPRRDDDP